MALTPYLVVLLLAVALGASSAARAIDVCGNGICLGTAVPPETCSSCPADCGVCPPPPPLPPILVVNMIPLDQSGETTQDSQPSLAVLPTNPQQMVGFTNNTLPKIANGFTTAPMFYSTNGGRNWAQSGTVIEFNGSRTRDVALSFGGASRLYAAAMSGTSNFLDLYRFASVPPAQPSILGTRTSGNLPFALARPNGTVDQVYFAYSDATFGLAPLVDRTVNGTVNNPVWSTFRLSSRSGCFSGLPAVSLTRHADGTMYGIYYFRRIQNNSCPVGEVLPVDVVVVRDDNG